MADWKQITARIRRARTGKDPAGQLTALFLKTRDAMVAFELARYFESNGNNEDAGKWYMTAAQRFRRADWKTKAQESATRLGATVAAEIPAPAAPTDLPEAAASDTTMSSPSPEPVAEDTSALAVEVTQQGEAPQEASAAERAPAKRHRRGRRGGRDHRRSSKRPEQTVPTPKELPPAPPAPRVIDVSEERPAHPAEPLELSTESPVAPSLRGRSGDPGWPRGLPN